MLHTCVAHWFFNKMRVDDKGALTVQVLSYFHAFFFFVQTMGEVRKGGRSKDLWDTSSLVGKGEDCGRCGAWWEKEWFMGDGGTWQLKE